MATILYRDGNVRLALVCTGAQLEIVPALSHLIPPATVIDKPVYSAFAESGLAAFLHDKSVDTLIVTGSETDVCVLATVLDAVDWVSGQLWSKMLSVAPSMKVTMPR